MPMPRKPIEQKKAEGTYRKERDGGKQNPKGKILEKPLAPPAELDAVGKGKFNALQRVLMEMHLMTPIDAVNIQIAAASWADYVQAKAHLIKKYGSVEEALESNMEGPKRIYRRMETSLDRYRGILSRYGSSPLDRGRIVIPQTKGKNEVEDFLAGM